MNFNLFLPPLHKAPPKAKLPPGPQPLPIIGNIHELWQNPNQSLLKLSETYGPLMYLKLGTLNTIVVSSPQIAKQVLKKHDQVLSGRPDMLVTQAHDHHKFSIAWQSATQHWRCLHRISINQMFSSIKLDSTASLRQEKVKKLQDYLWECSENGQVVNIADAAFTTTMNILSSTLFSRDLGSFYPNSSSQEFKDIVQNMNSALSSPNIADYLPILKFIDPQGLNRKSSFYVGKMLGKIDDMVSQRLQSENDLPMPSESRNDVLQSLIKLIQQNEPEIDRNDIVHLLLDLFVGGIEPVPNTVEWAMTELIQNPQKMEKARTELQVVLGPNKQVKESDMSRLPYLQAILKETFRLHPAVLFLPPHKAEESVEINGYTVPKGAQILVNIVAIGRDPSIWANPDSFEPERFLESKIDIRGQDFELIPFGSGRRSCPGLPLAYRMISMMVASMILNFDWKLQEGEELDMNEKCGVLLKKAVSLRAIPVQLEN